MSSLIRWISRCSLWPMLLHYPSSLHSRIFSIIQWLSGSQRKTPKEQDIESSLIVSSNDRDRAVTKPNEVTSMGKVEYCVIKSRGTTISGGASGLVERLPSGDVVKSPWPGFRAADCRRDITNEFQIYKKRGPHARLVKIINWDPEDCVLTMEYIPNGCLRDYLHTHNDRISMKQRLRWVRETAEGLQLLHSANVVHCDVEPKNLLLDADLGLKIADFSGSSLEGSQASACVGTKFLQPEFNWRSPPTTQNDLFSFGSTIYHIMTGQAPFHELLSNRVEELYRAHEFPDVAGIPCGEIIKQCWQGKVASAQEISNFIQMMEMKQFCEPDICRISIDIK